MYSALSLILLASVHLLALAFVSPTFWHDVLAQTPVRIIGAAGAVAVLVQTLKYYAPNAINGRWTLLVNVLLSLAAVFATMKPEEFWSETTLAKIIAVFFMAAGTHGVGKGLFAPSTDRDANPMPDPTNIPRTATQMRTPLAILFCLSLTAALIGCGVRAATPATAPPLAAGAADQVDANANRVLQTIQAFVAPIARDIKSGKLQASPAQRAAIDKVDSYYNLAIVAEKSYHRCMTAGGPVVVHPADKSAEPTPPSAPTCLALAGLSGALANAQGAFTEAQAMVSAAPPQ